MRARMLPFVYCHASRESRLKTLFVTGGHGFVGQWIQRLAPAIARRHGFGIVIPPVDFELLDSAQVDRQLAQSRPDAILHLAAQSNVPQSFKDPEGTFRVNVIGTLRLFEGLKRAGISPRVVFASSGDVYGQVPVNEMPIAEDRVPRPRNPYAVSKLATEALCYQWSRTEGLPAVIARPFNHIGAGQTEAFVIPAFARQIAQIKAGARPPVLEVGDIDVTRDFLPVEDVIEGYLVLLGVGEAGETYNIASGKDLRVRDLLGRMLAMAGVTAEIRKDPARFRPAEQRVVRGANAKIARLGWSPSHDIDAALADILQEWERKSKDG
jgi:GDP-4-dehydro-6-deoxy-D-mannose reductase